MEQRKSGKRLNMGDYLTPKIRKGILFIQVGNRNNGQIMGHLVDISASGLRVVSQIPFVEKKSYPLRIELPQQNNNTIAVSIDAVCVWCKQSQKDGPYEAGFHIELVSPKDLSMIESLLQK